MCCSRFVPAFVLLTLLAVTPSRASQVRVPVDQANSSLALTLCADPGGLGTDCDTDTKPLTGFLVVGLDNNGNPTQIALRNMDLQAVGNFNLNLSWLLGLARVDAVASNLRLYHSQPGVTNAFTAVTAGAYAFNGVPFRTAGIANYVINPTACGFVTFPCTSNIDLTTLGENTIDNLTGTLVVANGVLTVNVDFTFNTALDPANPALGNFTGHAIVRGSVPLNLALVPRGSDWKYLDDGSNLSGLWVLPPPDFDDSAWPLGIAQLGYGDGDEETVVRFGPNAASKHITTYFHHHFNVPDASIYTNLAVRVLHDDGVIVYLNGDEIYRANMLDFVFPDASELATTNVTGPAENIFFTRPSFSPESLRTGPNLVAVEIHQAAPDSSDISFDLELIGNGLFSNNPPAVTITSPTNGAIVASGALAISATATDQDGLLSLVEIYLGADKLYETTAAGPNYTFNWPNACPGTYTLTARATDNDGVTTVSAPVVVTVGGAPLVPASAVWKFLDDASNPAPAWRSNSFNDATWLSGPAQLGFGDGDEATVVARTNTATGATNVTVYFRHAFTVGSTSGITALSLQVLRDDGIIVYLNGAEVFRNNMPAGAVTSTTTALTNATAAEENSFAFTAALSPSLLAVGANLLAAEVHQSAIASSDLSFNLTLLGTAPTNRPPNTVAVTAPANNAVFALGAPIPLQASATDADGAVSRVEYFAGTNKLGQATSPPYNFTWNNAPAGVHSVTARAVDFCSAASVSAAITVRVGAFTMVPPGTSWRYLDNGSDQGTAWRNRLFNDAAWPVGNAQLGYGDLDEVTTINGGPTTNRIITTYFRRAFPVLDPSVITGLVVRLLRDDGAVIYVNGLEAFRSNMPAGAVNHLTLAPLAVGGTDESTFFLTEFSHTPLLAGTNVIAVEIHQQATNSSDVSFDLELIGLVGPVQPRLSITPSGGNFEVRWPSAAAGFRLQTSADLGSPANWQNQPGTPTDDGAWKTLLLTPAPPARFYRLRQ